MDCQKSRKFGAAFVLVQGLVTALFPQLSVKFLKMMIGKNFHNASELAAKPTYVRQLRAIGVGTVAAAGTDLLLESIQGGSSGGDVSEQSDPSDEDGAGTETDTG